MNKKTYNLLTEARSDLELAIVKSLSKAPLNPTELDEVLSITEADLLKDHELDLYMTQQIKWHAKNEQFRLRAQNLYTPLEGAEDLYPEKPYTRTNPIDESSSVSKISKRQLRRIIKEEKARLSEQMTSGSRIRGLHLDDAMSERTKTLMTHLYNNAVTDIIAEEGVLEEEAEEMAIVGVIEVVKEFLDSVGHRYFLE